MFTVLTLAVAIKALYSSVIACTTFIFVDVADVAVYPSTCSFFFELFDFQSIATRDIQYYVVRRRHRRRLQTLISPDAL